MEDRVSNAASFSAGKDAPFKFDYYFKIINHFTFT